MNAKPQSPEAAGIFAATLSPGQPCPEPLPVTAPSRLYRANLWRWGLRLARFLPAGLCRSTARILAAAYWLVAGRRREVVIQNFLPATGWSRVAAKRAARAMFMQFALKLVDLWGYEAGLPIDSLFGRATGWEHMLAAQSQGRGVLLLTPHLGNWEFGAPWLATKGIRVQVVSQAEPGEGFTELRQAARARWNIETLVIGHEPFAFLEIVKRLSAGATIALLVDRPPGATAVEVELFGQPFPASVAPAELARATGCVLLPVYLPREGEAYGAHVLPAVPYDRGSLRGREARLELTQRLMNTFDPVIREHLNQWFQFVACGLPKASGSPTTLPPRAPIPSRSKG